MRARGSSPDASRAALFAFALAAAGGALALGFGDGPRQSGAMRALEAIALLQKLVQGEVEL